MGIPAVQLSAVIAVAEMVGSNRIMLAQKIVNPVGNADLDPAEEKKAPPFDSEKGTDGFAGRCEGTNGLTLKRLNEVVAFLFLVGRCLISSSV